MNNIYAFEQLLNNTGLKFSRKNSERGNTIFEIFNVVAEGNRVYQNIEELEYGNILNRTFITFYQAGHVMIETDFILRLNITKDRQKLALLDELNDLNNRYSIVKFSFLNNNVRAAVSVLDPTDLQSNVISKFFTSIAIMYREEHSIKERVWLAS